MNYVFCVIVCCLPWLTNFPLQDEGVKLDFTRIAQPAIASRLELSDAQRAKVAELLTERINQLAASEPKAREGIRIKNNDALRALLSPTQLTKYREMVSGSKLRFNFRDEQWADVLRWFARESDLSLVMDQSPAGGFTYSDQKEYTGPQAIDLLNSVLLTKGYTLIRREKILIVASLQDGVPYELVPTETIEGLAERGKFEWVRIRFPLQGRSADAVLEAVQPMIGQFGKASALASAGQIMVTETAGKMEGISILINSVPPPKSSPAPPKPEPPPPRFFVVHAAKGLNIPATVEMLKSLFNANSIFGDETVEEIQVYATQEQQDLIKSSLDQMIANASDDLKVYSDTYPISLESLVIVQEQLLELFPEVKITADSQQERLVVLANTKTHRLIEESLQKIGEGSKDESKVTVVIYSAPEGEGENLSSLLQEMLPRSQIVFQQDRIAVRGNETEQKTAKNLVEQMAAVGTKGNQNQLRFYELNQKPAEVMSTIEALVKNGSVSWLESQEKLAVITDSQTQQVVKQTIDQINQDLPKKKKRALKIYQVTATQKSRFEQVFADLSEEFGEVTLVDGAAANEIAVLADQDQQQAIEQLIGSLEKLDENSEKVLTSFEFNVLDPAQLVSLLGEKFPTQKFVINDDRKTVLAWLRESEIESFRKEILALEAMLPRRLESSLEIYEVKGELSELQLLISPIAGNAKLTADTVNKRLIVWATQPEHEKIKETLGKVDVPASPGQLLEVYELGNASTAMATEMINSLNLDVSVTNAGNKNSLLIWGSKDSHAKIRALVDQLVKLKPDDKPAIETFPVDPRNSEQILAAVQAVFPESNLSFDPASKKIVSIGTRDLQNQVKALIEKLQPPQASSPPILMSYELVNSDAVAVVSMLQELHPDVRFAADERSNRILVTAELAEQPRFKAVIAQLDAKSSDRNEPQLRTYEAGSIQLEMVTELIQPLFPELKITFDNVNRKLLVVGDPFQHQKLKRILDQLSDSETVQSKLLRKYSIGDAPVDELQSVLLQMVPSANFAVNPLQRKLVAWATAEEQRLIETALQQLGGTPQDLSLKTFSLVRPVSAEITTLLQGLSATARVAAAADGKQLVVFASKQDHQMFESAIKELMVEKNENLELRVYTGSAEVIADAAAFVTSTLPDARIVSQGDAKKLMVWASSKEHARLTEAVEELKKKLEKPKTEKTIVIYPLGKIARATALQMITDEVEGVESLSDVLNDRLIIRGNPSAHLQIAQIIGELRKTFELVRAKSIKSHPVRADLKSQAISTISSLITAVEFLENDDDSLILAKATAEDHVSIQNLIQTLDKEIARKEPRSIVAYDLIELEKDLVNQVIMSRFPEVTFIDEPNSNRILAWASPQTHQQLPELLKQLEGTFATEKRMQVLVYNVDRQKMDAADVLELMDAALKENATIQIAEESNSLVIRAESEKHVKLKSEIDAIVSQIKAIPRPSTRVYELPAGNAQSVSSLVAPLLPNATQSVAADGKKLAVTTNEEGHNLIRSVLDQIQIEQKATELTTVVYRLDVAVPSVIEPALGSMAPAAKIISDDSSRSLIISASAQDHQAVSQILKQINDSSLGKRTEVFTLLVADPLSLVSAISAVSADAVVTADPATQSVVVTARDTDFPQIQALVDGLDKVAGEKQREMITRVYPFEKGRVDAVDMQAVIDPNLREGMSVRVNEVGNGLIVRTTAEKHLQLKEVFDQVVAQLPEEDRIVTKVYQLRKIEPQTIETVMDARYSNADFSVDEKTKTLVATVSLRDHEKIESILKEMQQQVGETKPVSKAFKLKSTSAVAASTALESLLPNAQVTLDSTSGTVIVTGTDDEILSAQDLVKQIDNSDEGKSTRVYRLAEADPRYVAPAIESLIPAAEVSGDRYSKSLFVTATELEHQQIAKMVEELNFKKGMRSEVYRLSVANPVYVMPAVQALLPEATVSADRYSKSLFVTATEEDHVEVERLIEKMNGNLTTQRSEVYKLAKADPRYLMPAIQSLLPNATVSGDRYSNTLFVTGTEEDHQQVQALIDKLNGDFKAQRSEVYKLTKADPRYLMPAIQSLLPDATVSGDRYSNTLFVTGTEEDHQQVQALIDKLNGDTKAQRSEVYKLTKADPVYLMPAIESLLPDATVSADRISKSLFVTGSDEDHSQVKTLIEKLNGTANDQTTEVYRLEKASSVVLQPAIQALIPDGSVTADQLSNTIVVSANPAEHLKVSEVIGKLDRAAGDELVLKIYRSKFDNPDPLNQSIANMFRDDKEVRINYEWENRRLLIVASEAKHKMINTLIERIDQARPKYENRSAKVYHLENIESRAAEGIIRNLYNEAVPRIDTRIQDGSNALVVVATSEQHRVLGPAIKEVDGELRQLEVFPLVNVDPYTVELAIEQLFAEIPENMRPTATSDFGTQQLFVRGTAVQIGLVRDLLNKMGESFGDGNQVLSKGSVRTIPFRGNAGDALREIESIWPRLRKNKIEIIRPGGTKINRLPGSRNDPQPPTARKTQNENSIKQPTPATEPKGQDTGGKPTTKPDSGNCGDEWSYEWTSEDNQEENKKKKQEPKIKIENLQSVDANQATAGQQTSRKADQKQELEQPQVVVIAGDNEITIASSDLEALDQLEYLLRTLQKNTRNGIGSSNFAVFLLANSSAKETARLLTELFEAIPEMERQGSVGNAVFVADERLNAMIVYGTRKERDVIKEIIEVLDAEDLPDSLTTPLPELVQVEHSSANRVLEILRSVYSNQLSSGGGRKKVEIPEGVSTAVASLLTQINAATAGPILTLGLDEKTNSIVMRAPAELGREVKSFIQRLDESAAKTVSRKIKVLQIQGTNADRVRQILNSMAQEN